MNCVSILSNINLQKQLRSLDINSKIQYFINSMRVTLWPSNLLNCHVLGIVSVTMHFYELIKYTHIRHFQLNKVSIHKQQVPIKRDLLILNVVNALQFMSIYCSYFEKLQLSFYNFQQQSLHQIVDQPKKFSRLLLHPLIIKNYTLEIH